MSVINSLISIEKSDISENKWLVQSPAGNNFLINSDTKKLLMILKESDTLEKSYDIFCSEFNTEIPLNEYYNFINKKLGGLGILKDDQTENNKRSYLTVKHKLLGEKGANILSKPFQFLYSEKIFWLLFSLAFLFSLYSILKINIRQLQDHKINYILWFLIFFISTCLHEIGHIAACAKNKIKHGYIGWGVYFLFPVFYSDVSNVWAAKKNIRIITNLGGIFNEMVFSIGLYIYYLIYHNQTFLLAYCSIIIRVLWQLYPFVRSDGYWILSDLLSIPNLLPKANDSVKYIFHPKNLKIYLKKENGANELSFYKRLFILIYGLVNIGVTIFFIISILRSYWKDILYFPKTIIFILYDLVHLKVPGKEISAQLFLISVWYYVLVLFILRFFNKQVIK